MTPLNKRIENWVAHLQGESISPAADRVLDVTNAIDTPSTARYKNTAAIWYAAETTIRLVLDTWGVSVAQYAMYIAFGRELVKLSQSGWSLATGYGKEMSTVLRHKWVDRGLSSAVMEAIQLAVQGGSFGLVTPPTPLLPANNDIVSPHTLGPTLACSVAALHTFDFRVFHAGVLVVQHNDNATESWLVTPDLVSGNLYTWDARKKETATGVYSEWFTPAWSFGIVMP